MRVAYVTLYDPRDPAAFGGRVHLAAPALEAAGLDLVDVRPDDLLQRAWRRLAWETGRRRHGPLYNVHRHRGLIGRCGRLATARLRRLRPDVVLSPMSPGAQPVARLGGDWPVVIWTDTTLAGWLDELPEEERERQPRANVADGLACERAALQRCAVAIFWTDWAAEAALEEYDLDPSRVRVIPSGPSVACDRDEATVRRLVARRPADVCRLLHVGVGWHRKGADVAVAVADELDRRGVPVRLTVVGSPPPDGVVPAGVECPGFISKSTAAGRRRLGELFAGAHFFLLPTRSDCSPLVLNEACSFGLPCLASRIAGIPTLVREGRNGWTVPGGDVDAYADRIEAAFSDRARYEALALDAFAEFRRRLSWPVAAAAVADVLREVVAEGAAR
ncbi:MAG: glycosyltransferase family 4 protein [Planctomycetota bacterium]|jgi:glycosyltransferase involved in cell wall biosynthesis